MSITTVLVALVSYRFLFLDLNVAFSGMEGHILERRTAFLAHIIAAPVCLLVGVLQFLPNLRRTMPAFHRWSGRLYGLAVLIGGLAGLYMASGPIGGPIAATGFATLSILWLGATGYAVWLAMNRKIGLHRRWMFRSFALSLAAVTLRLELPLFFIAGMEYPEASRYVAWLCWIPNLLIVEWLLRWKKNK